jgi:diadenosine tetraphosphatase ApaH/serine/threonine PP2A family protein phosphatase
MLTSSTVIARMRIAFLADIHSNREAMDAVLTAIRQVGADQIVLLGDIVGYGPDPAYSVERTAGLVEDGAICVMGNHDAAVSKGEAGMSPNARFAIKWTKERLGSDHLEFLLKLPVSAAMDDLLFVHASAWEPEKWHYINDISSASKCLAQTSARLTFCGHTHVPAYFHALPGQQAQLFRPISEKPIPVSALRRAVVVVGSVGQPRDRISAACFGLYDTDERTFVSHRVPYPVETTLKKIKDTALPDWLGMRLLLGR